MDPLNTEQVKQIVSASGEAAAAAAIRKFVQDYPHLAGPPALPTPKPETPTYVKWGAGIGATIVAAAILWAVSTLNQLQITVARIDERQINDTSKADLLDLQKRVTVLERERPHQ